MWFRRGLYQRLTAVRFGLLVTSQAQDLAVGQPITAAAFYRGYVMCFPGTPCAFFAAIFKTQRFAASFTLAIRTSERSNNGFVRESHRIYLPFSDGD